MFAGHTSSVTGVHSTLVSMIEPEHIRADVVPVLSRSPTSVQVDRCSFPRAAPFCSETALPCFPRSLQSCRYAARGRLTRSRASDGYEGDDYHIHLAHGEPPQEAIEEASELVKRAPEYDHYSDMWYWAAEDAAAADRLLNSDLLLEMARRGAAPGGGALRAGADRCGALRDRPCRFRGGLPERRPGGDELRNRRPRRLAPR